MVLTDKPEVDQSMQPCLLKNSPNFYGTPTPNAMAKAGKIVLIDCSCPCTITGVQYLYPEPKHESYSNTTYYNSWSKRKHS